MYQPQLQRNLESGNWTAEKPPPEVRTPIATFGQCFSVS